MRLRALLAVAAWACEFAACSGPAPAPTVLTLYSWEDYVPPEVLADFEAETGIAVEIVTFGTQHEVVDSLQEAADRFDVIIVTGDIAGRLAELRLIAPLDRARVANLRHISPDFLGWSWDPENTHTAPYDWGTTGLVYNSQRLPAPSSWSAFETADPARAAIDGDWMVALGLGLKGLGSSLNYRNDDELAAAAQLVARRVERGIPLMESVDLRDALVEGRIDLGMAYSGDAAWALERNPDLRFVIPEEGADLYVDVLAVSRGSRQQAAANDLINYLLRPDVHRRATDFTGYGYPGAQRADVSRVQASMSQQLHEEIGMRHIGRLERWRVLDTLAQTAWNRAWAGVGFTPAVPE